MRSRRNRTYRPITNKTFCYLVVFKSSTHQDSYTPYVTAPQSGGTEPHGLDTELVRLLPLFWLIQHLPRWPFDFDEQSASLVRSAQYHNLSAPCMPVTLPMLKECYAFVSKKYIPIVISSFPCRKEIARILKTFPPVLCIDNRAESSQQLINDAWQILYSATVGGKKAVQALKCIKYVENAPALLPAKFISRQIGGEVQEGIGYSNLDLAWRTQVTLNAQASFEREGCLQPNPNDFLARQAAAEENTAFSVAVASPGVSPSYCRRVYHRSARSYASFSTHGKGSRTLREYDERFSESQAEIESSAIHLIAARCAQRAAGLGVVTSSIAPELFVMMATLEKHIASEMMRPRGNELLNKQPNVRFAWKQLNRIARRASYLFDERKLGILKRARIIYAYTNFPVGLITLEGDSSPLCCRCPVVYRPLIPLTRTLQRELAGPQHLELPVKPKILIAEGIPFGDGVRHASMAALKELEGELLQLCAEVMSIDAATPAKLNETLAMFKPEILVLSAHGETRYENNAAVLYIGDQPCIGPELANLPPLVILSSCTTSTRGTGSVNVADLLLREGSKAIICSQLPVEVYSNTRLISAFLKEVLLALQGKRDHVTVADAWYCAQTMFAFNDLCTGSLRAARVWDECSGTPMVPSVASNRLYQAYEEYLVSLGGDASESRALEAWLANQSYVPYTLFYQLLGWPESLILRPDLTSPEHSH